MQEKNTAVITNLNAVEEKSFVALTSLGAAVFLTVMKAAVGFWTGSLGILSEAAHSGLDFSAALATYLAVRISTKPADEDHHYGHGKFESFSALFETLLLLATCGWIIHAAVTRILERHFRVEVNVWSFTVMLVAIAIDFTRSRALTRVARKYRSQALEADALHFQSDIYSSLAVIAGLVFVRLGFPLADPIAALGVSLFVVMASLRLGLRASYVLLDRRPPGLAERIRTAVASNPNVLEIRKLRVRDAGTQLFVDLTLAVVGEMTLNEAHGIADQAEASIKALNANADVTVHVEPK